MNLLIVDDEYIAIRGLIQGIEWKKYGINGSVWSASDASQAKTILQQEKIDIILCDIEMPGENGIELIREVHDKYPGIVSIFLTCHAKFEYAQEAIKLGCQGYILTPAPYEVIAQTIQKTVIKIEEERKNEKLKNYGHQWLQQQEKIAEDVQGDKRSSHEIIQDTTYFIIKNLSLEELSVTYLAKKYYLNEDYLNRIFKREKGITINRYIIRERMELAGKLLENSSLSNVTVASRVGYSNYSYFVSSFKKYYNCTPSQYKEEKLKSKS